MTKSFEWRFNTTALLTASLAFGSVLGGCSSGSLSSEPSTISGSATARSPVIPLTRRAEHSDAIPLSAVRRLAVSDVKNGAVEILNRAYKLKTKITGLCKPWGDYYDGKGNLYEAQGVSSGCTGANIIEYNQSGALVFTYSSGLSNPINVTADGSGNVYAVDYGNFYSAFVVEYPQGSNTPLFSCTTDLQGFGGAAVDAHGNVFVTGNYYGGHIFEYAGGLSGCSSTPLSVSVATPEGIQVDKQGNVVVCDGGIGVDIIKPPYNSISSTISSNCTNVALNKKQNKIFIAEPSNGDVLVADYPGGTVVTTLGSANGLSEPWGVATYGR